MSSRFSSLTLRDGKGALRQCGEGLGEQGNELVFFSEGGIQSAFCIQNVVQYFGMGHWCV